MKIYRAPEGGNIPPEPPKKSQRAPKPTKPKPAPVDKANA